MAIYYQLKLWLSLDLYSYYNGNILSCKCSICFLYKQIVPSGGHSATHISRGHWVRLWTGGTGSNVDPRLRCLSRLCIYCAPNYSNTVDLIIFRVF